MLIKLVRLGRDAEVRWTSGNNPTAVATLAMAYDIGRGDQKRTQWIEAALWGERAQKLEQYLTKGTQLVAYLDDIELEQYTTRDNRPGAKIKARVTNLQFAGGGNNQQQQAPQGQHQQQAQQQSQQFQQPQQQPGGFSNDFDDDIPF